MEITEPILFEPLFMERVWGGRALESLGKALPPGSLIGESWEVVDREEVQSVVHEGFFRGKTLHELWVDFHGPVFGGNGKPFPPRFPLLFKLLDAQERLSVQVHPPAEVAVELKGEPKTEMWFIIGSHRDHDIFAGLRRGVTRADFEQALLDGTVADKIHRIEVKAGDAILIPSGRIHAIGAGNIIIEVQQNSDTTYRVFDWNRQDTNGKVRDLHIEQALRSTDFNDIEPAMTPPNGESVVVSDFFRVEKWTLEKGRTGAAPGEFAIFTCLEGQVECGSTRVKRGDFFLLPAAMADRELRPLDGSAMVLRTTLP